LGSIALMSVWILNRLLVSCFFTLIAGVAEMERGVIAERTSDALGEKLRKVST